MGPVHEEGSGPQDQHPHTQPTAPRGSPEGKPNLPEVAQGRCTCLGPHKLQVCVSASTHKGRS